MQQPWDETPWDDDQDGSTAGEAAAVTDDAVEGVVTDFADDYDAPTADLAAAGPSVDSVDISTPLSMDEARELTEQIRSTADVLYVLIARAHAGKAWQALGYNSFAGYVESEFSISRSRAYQLLNQAQVIQAIEAATPDGTNLHISEAQARDLKSVIGEIVPEIAERTRDVAPTEAAQVVEEIVDDYREKKREQREQREQDALEAEERDMDRADRDGFSSTGGGGDFYQPEPSPVTVSYQEEDELDAALIRRNVQAAYDLYSSLSALNSMPDVQAVIDTIPAERRVQINSSLPAAQQWLATFAELWEKQPWQNGADLDGHDVDADFDADFDGDEM